MSRVRIVRLIRPWHAYVVIALHAAGSPAQTERPWVDFAMALSDATIVPCNKSLLSSGRTSSDCF